MSDDRIEKIIAGTYPQATRYRAIIEKKHDMNRPPIEHKLLIQEATIDKIIKAKLKDNLGEKHRNKILTILSDYTSRMYEERASKEIMEAFKKLSTEDITPAIFQDGKLQEMLQNMNINAEYDQIAILIQPNIDLQRVDLDNKDEVRAKDRNTKETNMSRKRRTRSTEEGPADNITVRARAEPNSEGKFNLKGEANEIKESIIEHANKYYRNISKDQLKKELDKISDKELKDHIADKHSLDHFIHSVSKKATKPQLGTKGNETSMARVYEVTIENKEGTNIGAKKVFEAIKYHAVATEHQLIMIPIKQGEDIISPESYPVKGKDQRLYQAAEGNKIKIYLTSSMNLSRLFDKNDSYLNAARQGIEHNISANIQAEEVTSRFTGTIFCLFGSHPDDKVERVARELRDECKDTSIKYNPNAVIVERQEISEIKTSNVTRQSRYNSHPSCKQRARHNPEPGRRNEDQINDR